LAGPQLLPVEQDWLRLYRPAGVILFARNVTDRAQLAALCAQLRQLLPPKGEIVADHEGGPISVLAAAVGVPPAPFGLGILDDPALTHTVSRETGERLHQIGLHRVLAPCADVLVESKNPVIGARAFGADQARVARHVAAAVAGFQQGGVAVCLKHWPGHGGTTGDSHLGPACSREGELPAPFQAGIVAGADALLVGHLIAGDSTGTASRPGLPATLDPAVIERARNLATSRSLLLFSDDVTMGALRPALSGGDFALPDAGIGGMLDPALLPRGWFAALATAGCDRLLCRGIPWTALPLAKDRAAPASPAIARPPLPAETAAATPRATAIQPSLSYREVRRRLANLCAGEWRSASRLLWLDHTGGDNWGEAVDLKSCLEERFPTFTRWEPGTILPRTEDHSLLLVTSHRPLSEPELRDGLGTQLLVERGYCLTMGHPSLPSLLARNLPKGWQVQAVYDTREEDLLPVLDPDWGSV
jgi:hypothetical protein